MKKLISILMVLAVMNFGQQQFDNNANAQAAPAVFVIGCLVVGVVIVILVTQHGGENKLRTFVLEKSHYDGYWVPVATNSLRMVKDKAWPTFEVYMTDKTALYRLKEVPVGNNLLGEPILLISGSATEKPIVQH